MTLKPLNHAYRRTNGTSLTGGKGMGYIYVEIELTNEDDLALVLLGAHPLQGQDAFIDAKRERLLVNPESPDNPKSYIRQVEQVSLSI